MRVLLDENLPHQLRELFEDNIKYSRESIIVKKGILKSAPNRINPLKSV